MNLFVLKLQVIYTAIMSGMMLMYVVTLGSYFNYILKNKTSRAFQDYSLFRKNTRVRINHSIILLGQLLTSIVSLIINFDRGWVPLVLAVTVPVLMLILHLLTGFGKSENLVNSGKEVSDEIKRNYLAWNLPIHIIYSILYTLSAILLVGLL